ncbi:amino acid ABC transporter membrane protein (PAAT family) [Rhizobium sp. PP-F2F-G48]|uniref:amino acid ABC transporter permease n=1 Tax=Rhizobium sp. PP-F2F-G48 TaxID=2135651 RepID=UPI0010F157FD|nr:amino acid ABC transporter permease [Rhizobium sp. PP-F2F-G48]TCM55047.1 amino acid ABC transporter membrane protein (PAAT family) [Rhizobium sp. PP-F2F-G48]
MQPMPPRPSDPSPHVSPSEIASPSKVSGPSKISGQSEISGPSLRPTSGRGAISREFPWWLIALAAIAVGLAVLIAVNDLYSRVFTVVAAGIGVTIFVTIVGFALATLVGLGVALMALSRRQVLRQVARFYTEVIRGIPVLVLLFYIAFVGTPALVWLINLVLTPLISAGAMEPVLVRDLSLMWRAIIALTIGYSAFIAEVFRAGIQSVDRGQVEAAEALGLNRFQRFRLVVFPQAIRTILPPLGNDFVAMIKDSSLVSVLGVQDITQMGKVYASGSFRFFETYSIVAYIYLLLTIGLSLALRGLEKRLRRGHRG